MGRSKAEKKAKKKALKQAALLLKAEKTKEGAKTTPRTGVARRGQNNTTAARKELTQRRKEGTLSGEDSDDGSIAKSPAAGTRSIKKRVASPVLKPTPTKQRRTSTRSAEKATAKLTGLLGKGAANMEVKVTKVSVIAAEEAVADVKGKEAPTARQTLRRKEASSLKARRNQQQTQSKTRTTRMVMRPNQIQARSGSVLCSPLASGSQRVERISTG